MSVIRLTLGAISLSISSHFPIMGKSTNVKPVMLPPGRAKLAIEALSDWIDDHGEDNRDGAGRLFQRRNDRSSAGGNEVRCRTHQFRRVCLDLGKVAARKSMLDLDVAVFHPSKRLKSLSKGRNPGVSFRIVLGRCPCKNTTRRSRSACCARAASGHAAAALPRSVMNSRRFMCPVRTTPYARLKA